MAKLEIWSGDFRGSLGAAKRIRSRPRSCFRASGWHRSCRVARPRRLRDQAVVEQDPARKSSILTAADKADRCATVAESPVGWEKSNVDRNSHTSLLVLPSQDREVICGGLCAKLNTAVSLTENMVRCTTILACYSSYVRAGYFLPRGRSRTATGHSHIREIEGIAPQRWLYCNRQSRWYLMVGCLRRR